MMKIAIIGAGAAGLFAAKKMSEHSDVSVVVFEKAKNVATKLRASGGGRANIMNADIRPECYNNCEFMSRFLQKTDYLTIYNEFVKMGLKMRVDEEQRVYPATFFSATVVEILLHNLPDRVQWVCEHEVKKLLPHHQKWKIDNYPDLFDKVLIMTGSPAGMIEKNQMGFASFLQKMPIRYHAFQPSLVGFKIKNYPKYLFGCRAKAQVTLLKGNKRLFQECGEVIFKEDGLSGIVVLNASAYYNRLPDQRDCSLSLDFLFDDNQINISDYLLKYKTLTGLLHPKLCRLYEQHPFDPHALRMEILATYPLAAAQVGSGGVDVAEVDETLQLKRFPNLYVGGEMLDIDGVCGGYNLFFAFASAFLIVNNLFREN